MIGFIMGAITAFIINKIASLEKKNKKIIQKLESSMNLKASQTPSPSKEDKTINDKSSEQISSNDQKETDSQKKNTSEADLPQQEELKTKKKKKKTNENKSEDKIQPDPDFKPPENRERKEEEIEWSVVKKKSSKRPK